MTPEEAAEERYGGIDIIFYFTGQLFSPPGTLVTPPLEYANTCGDRISCVVTSLVLPLCFDEYWRTWEETKLSHQVLTCSRLPTAVGVYFGQDIDGQVFVEALLPGGSAALARAIKPDDILLKLDGNPCLGIALERLRALVLGPQG